MLREYKNINPHSPSAVPVSGDLNAFYTFNNKNRNKKQTIL